MLLDIIVPHYNEPLEVVKPFFDVLESQKGIDFSEFKVHLVHNGTVSFDPDDFHYNNIQLVETFLHKPGVSRARNYGLAHSTGEWVCFCDCDDCYTSIFSLMMVFHVLKDENSRNFDLIWGSFYAHDGAILTKTDGFDSVFIHNKYYRRQFLMDKNVRFNEKLRMSEDSAFNTIVRLELGPRRIGQINSSEPLYAWCRRPGSITKDFSKWIYNTEGHFDRNLYILDEYRTRHLAESDLMIARTLTDAYAMLHKLGITEDQTKFKKRVADFYLENKLLFERIPEEKVKEALAASDKDVCTNDKELLIRPAFKDWLKSLIV